MSAAASKPPFVSFEEYLRLEAISEERHDYIDGQIISMAGGSPEHSRIVANLIGETRAKLKGKKCEVFDPNLRIGLTRGWKTHYPDASIVCGPLEYDERDRSHQTILNPTVIFDVLSPSTEAYDRLQKFDHYMTLPSLREYVLIRQDRPEVLTYFRQEDGTWAIRIIRDLENDVPIPSVGIEIAMRELYDRVEFPPPAAGETAAAV